MKKYVLMVTAAALLWACGGGNDDKAGATTAAVDASSNPAYDKGLDALAKYDCLTCHKVEDRIKGPSYREVANKYAGQSDAVAYLVGKIIKGGSGVWGQEVMTPHPMVTQADAEAIAKYILLLKK